MNRILLCALLLAATPLMAQTATTLPENVVADIAAVKQDQANVEAARVQLRTDRSSNSAAAAADRTALEMARVQLEMDLDKLRQDAYPIILADQTALYSALSQLHTDRLAGNTAAITADEAAVQQAELQLEVDLEALGLGSDSRHDGHHRR
jgi:hypothetical protein